LYTWRLEFWIWLLTGICKEGLFRDFKGLKASKIGRLRASGEKNRFQKLAASFSDEIDRYVCPLKGCDIKKVKNFTFSRHFRLTFWAARIYL